MCSVDPMRPLHFVEATVAASAAIAGGGAGAAAVSFAKGSKRQITRVLVVRMGMYSKLQRLYRQMSMHVHIYANK